MTPADLQLPERGSAPVEDPAVVAGKEAAEAAAAWSVYAKAHPTFADEQTPEYKAIKERSEKADDAFADAPVASVAGVLVKLRALGKDITEDHGPEGWQQGHVKTVTAFLEGFTGAPSVVGDDPAVGAFAELEAASAALDPVLVLFAEWGALQDEAIELEKADPDSDDPDIEEQRDKAYKRQSDVEDQISDTAAPSAAGIAVKLRLMAYAQYPMKGLSDLYATPAKDTDFKGMIEAWREDTGLSIDDNLLLGALCDAEQVAGVAKPDFDPVVTLFAEWGAINEEVIAHLAAIPEGAGKGTPGVYQPVAEAEKPWDAALDRREAVEQKILETPATSMRGVAIKIRIASHHILEAGDVDKRYATPSRDIDYVDADPGLGAGGLYAVSALRDAERLAGVS